MASGPGTSGGSSGRGDQLTCQRLNVELSSNSRHSSTLLPGSVSSMVRIETQHLKCPVCHEYPRLEVFQCSNGHLICHECMAKITRCPLCRVYYGDAKIRNRVAEIDLDEMTYTCIYRNYGCLKTNIPRNERSDHEACCNYNPTQAGVKFCSLFGSTRACKFRIDPSLMQESHYSGDVIQHLLHIHDNGLFQIKAEIGETKSLRFRVPTSFECSLKPVVLVQVCEGTTRQSIGYFVLIQRVEMPERRFSWDVIRFGSDLEHVNVSRIKVNFSLKAKADPAKTTMHGNGCVPNLNWTIKTTCLYSFIGFMVIPVEKRPRSSFSIPLNFLSEFYMQPDDMLEIGISFDH